MSSSSPKVGLAALLAEHPARIVQRIVAIEGPDAPVLIGEKELLDGEAVEEVDTTKPYLENPPVTQPIVEEKKENSIIIVHLQDRIIGEEEEADTPKKEDLPGNQPILRAKKDNSIIIVHLEDNDKLNEAEAEIPTPEDTPLANPPSNQPTLAEDSWEIVSPSPTEEKERE